MMIGRKIFNQVEKVCVSRKWGTCIKKGGTNICTLFFIFTKNKKIQIVIANLKEFTKFYNVTQCDE